LKNKMKIKIKKLNLNAKIPQYAHKEDGGFDLYTTENVCLFKGEYRVIPTGIAMNIPDGYVGLIWDKSGLATKKGLKVLGGVDDAGYTGEVFVGMINLGHEDHHFSAGEKVAQMIIQKREVAEFEEVDELDEFTRGNKKQGSSGK